MVSGPVPAADRLDLGIRLRWWFRRGGHADHDRRPLEHGRPGRRLLRHDRPGSDLVGGRRGLHQHPAVLLRERGHEVDRAAPHVGDGDDGRVDVGHELLDVLLEEGVLVLQAGDLVGQLLVVRRQPLDLPGQGLHLGGQVLVLGGQLRKAVLACLLSRLKLAGQPLDLATQVVVLGRQRVHLGGESIHLGLEVRVVVAAAPHQPAQQQTSQQGTDCRPPGSARPVGRPPARAPARAPPDRAPGDRAPPATGRPARQDPTARSPVAGSASSRRGRRAAARRPGVLRSCETSLVPPHPRGCLSPCPEAEGLSPALSVGLSLAGLLPQVDAGIHGVLVDLGQLLVGQVEPVQGTQVLLELLDAARADQHRGQARVA